MSDIRKVDEFRYEIPDDYVKGMKTKGIIYATETLIAPVLKDNSALQVANVAALPGIVGKSMAMPDIHYGYGFPIGGVAAFDYYEGVISPGGVGYDINCGVRLLRTGVLSSEMSKETIQTLSDTIYREVPSGVGVGGNITLSENDISSVVSSGARWCVENGFGEKRDLKFIEEGGEYSIADPKKVSHQAFARGKKQLGTLGAGNHFIEIQKVSDIYDDNSAKTFGLEKDELAIMLHTGSRGFGHQVCSDYIKVMRKASNKYSIPLNDPQLCCAPAESSEGQDYLAAMACAANYAWANRQAITHYIRSATEKALGVFPEVVYDIAHNMAKIETHKVDGEKRKLVVHRKGATRAFGPGHNEIPEKYSDVGQPVIIPGDMGTASYILAGTSRAMEETFGSTCHGAGRSMSRTQAIKTFKGSDIKKRLSDSGIHVSSGAGESLAEEAPDAYKNIDEVIKVVDEAGISRKIIRLRPLCVIKG